MKIDNKYLCYVIIFGAFYGIRILFSFIFTTLGPPLPKRILNHSMVEVMGDLFVLGGENADSSHLNAWNSQKYIYKLHCSSEECAWKTLNQELKVPRREFVAIPVMDSFVNCIASQT